MYCVTLIPRAVLFALKTLRGILLVLEGNVVLTFALSTSEGDFYSHSVTR